MALSAENCCPLLPPAPQTHPGPSCLSKYHLLTVQCPIDLSLFNSSGNSRGKKYYVHFTDERWGLREGEPLVQAHTAWGGGEEKDSMQAHLTLQPRPPASGLPCLHSPRKEDGEERKVQERDEKEGHQQLKTGGAAEGVCVLSASLLSHLLLNFPFEALKQRQVRRSDCSKSYSKPGCDSKSCAPHSTHIHRMVAEERRCLPRELSRLQRGVFHSAFPAAATIGQGPIQLPGLLVLSDL